MSWGGLPSRFALCGALVTCAAVPACSRDSARRDAIRGGWACANDQFAIGSAEDEFSFHKDGRYSHARQRTETNKPEIPRSYDEWVGTWRIDDGLLVLDGKSAFSAVGKDDPDAWPAKVVWRAGPGNAEAKSMKISFGDIGFELESDDPFLRNCTFVRSTAWPKRPSLASQATAAPAASASARPPLECNCAPADLACNMRCAAK